MMEIRLPAAPSQILRLCVWNFWKALRDSPGLIRLEKVGDFRVKAYDLHIEERDVRRWWVYLETDGLPRERVRNLVYFLKRQAAGAPADPGPDLDRLCLEASAMYKRHS